MSLTAQPRFLASLLTWFASVDAAHGFAVNLVVVAALTITGAAFLSGRPRLIRPVLIGFGVLCLATWVLIQDLGFLGGLGTDPNTMIPFILLAAAGYLALTRLSAPLADPVPVPESTRERALEPSPAAPHRAIRRQAWPSPVLTGAASAIAIGGASLILLGAIPMAAAEASPQADPILAQSIAGPARTASYLAPGFTLTSQRGVQVTLASLHGRVILLSFIDPACQSTCPPIDREFRAAARLLGPAAKQVRFVEIMLSSRPGATSAPTASGRSADPPGIPGWLFLTGPSAKLQAVWQEYGVSPPTGPTARESGRDAIYLIGQSGRVRLRYRAGIGPGSAATTSSFAVLLAAAARAALTTGR
jgi:cytochrome oxidase Cu insertion factor (SCO1/SenC/PrrC family)